MGLSIPQNRDELMVVSANVHKHHVDFQALVSRLRLPTTVASLVVIVALIVIVSASFCLALPGVNVMRDVVGPALIPAIICLLATIPVIVKCVKLSREKTRIFETFLYPQVREILGSRLFDDARQKVSFVEKYILTQHHPRHYQAFYAELFTKVFKEYTEAKKGVAAQEGRQQSDADKLQESRFQARIDTIKDVLTNLLQSETKDKLRGPKFRPLPVEMGDL